MSSDDRQDENNAKYKHFRNFMVNELGITRQDIEAWTKQSVANEVQKLIGQINIEDLIAQQVKTYTRQALDNRYINNSELVQEVAKKLASQITIGVNN